MRFFLFIWRSQFLARIVCLPFIFVPNLLNGLVQMEEVNNELNGVGVARKILHFK